MLKETAWLKNIRLFKDVSHTARKHSVDMVKHNYFDHVNQKKLSPFDRLKRWNRI